jgi:hypothetical protein
MPVGHWSGGGNDEPWDAWDEPCVVSRNVSPEAFMEELCASAGGYSNFFRTLVLHYVGWWVAILIVPTVFLDHHKCEGQLGFFAWLLYAATLFAMLAMAVLLELSIVQRLGLLKAGELSYLLSERRWHVPLVGTVLWKLDTYTDVAFIFIARDCGSSLWWASLAAFAFVVVFCQFVLNMCFACTDCDHELPSSFGFVLMDFKLVNSAIRSILPFDPDASDLPIGRPVTLRTTGHLVGMEKVVSDIAQVCIQIAFIRNRAAPQSFVLFSVFVGMTHGTLAIITVIRECVQDEWAMQTKGVQLGTALMPTAQLDHGSFSTTLTPAPLSKHMENSHSLDAFRGDSRKQPTQPKAGPKPTQIGSSAFMEIPDLL